MAYYIAPFLMTLSGLQGHLHISRISNVIFCTVVHKLTRYELTNHVMCLLCCTLLS